MTIAVDAAEWALIIACRTGAQVRFRVPKQRFGTGDELTGWMTGSVIWAMVYDGIMAKVLEDDPDDRIVWDVNPSCGAKVEMA